MPAKDDVVAKRRIKLNEKKVEDIDREILDEGGRAAERMKNTYIKSALWEVRISCSEVGGGEDRSGSGPPGARSLPLLKYSSTVLRSKCGVHSV
jgi:hypothetical protein